jgi:hypothetical protein
MSSNPTTCFPTRPPINPLRLASNYRDYWGDLDARLTELTDPLLDAACYVPRIFHAPDTEAENLGVLANDFLEYVLVLPAGSFIVGFQHCFTSLANPNDSGNPPVRSSFRFQITDVQKQYRFFEKPVPEAWLLNDAPSSNPQGLINGLYNLNPSPRLLPALYPVTPPGEFRVEFWNTLASTNTGIRLSLLVAIPDLDLLGRG